MRTDFKAVLIKCKDEGFERQKFKLGNAVAGTFGIAKTLMVEEACDFLGSCNYVVEEIDKGNWQQIEQWSTAMRKKRAGLR
jgi:hypothetical protein